VQWSLNSLAIVCAFLAACGSSRRIQKPDPPPGRNIAVHAVGTGDPVKKTRCSIRILAEPPIDGVRSLGTIHLVGHVSREGEIINLVDQKACQMGADAIFVREIQQRSVRGEIDYEIRAAVYLFGNDDVPSTPFKQQLQTP